MADDVGRAGFVTRQLFRLRTYLARTEELTNTNISDSLGLLSRMGDADRDSTARKSKRGRFDVITSIRRKYKGEDDWGNEFLGCITDFHAALHWGQGLVSTVVDEEEHGAEPEELEVWNTFLEFNNFDEEGLIALGVAGELDGQILLRLQVDEEERQVRAWIVPLLETRYQVVYDVPWTPARVILHPDTEKEETLGPDEFVFVKYRSISNGDYGVPRCRRIEKRLESLDQALDDWRKANKVSAAPTPTFYVSGIRRMKQLRDWILASNWKIGKAIVLDSAPEANERFEMVEHAGSSLASLESEIVMLAKIVSGGAQIPVHFLGFSDLMSNRSVADADLQPSILAAKKDQKTSTGFVEEAKNKVLTLYSVLHGRAYDPAVVDVAFPDIHLSAVEEQIAKWLPARVSGEISRKTFHSKVGVDPDDEARRIEDEGAQNGAGEDELAEEDARIEEAVRQARERETGRPAAGRPSRAA